MSAYGQYAGQTAREAQEGYGRRVQMAHTGALGTKAAINHAIPQIRQIFAGAEGASQGTAHLLGQALEGAAPDSPYRQSQASESALALQQLVARKASEEGRLKQEAVSAQQGQQFANVTAQNILAKELRSLLQKRGNLSGEEGLFASTQADKLARASSKEQAEERRSERTASTSRANAEEGNRTRRETAAGKAGAKGSKPLTQLEHNAGASSIASMRDVAKELIQVKPAITRAELLQELRLGHPAAEGQPAIPAYKPNALMAAGLDLAQFGYLRPNTERRLRSERYDLKRLGSLGVKRAPRTPEGVRGGVSAPGR